MKVLKFTSNVPDQKMFGNAVRKNVRDYFQEKGISSKGNLTMYIKALVMLAAYIVPFIILLTVPMGFLPAILLVLLIGVGEAGIGMAVMHDAAHGALSRFPWVNRLFASSMYLLGSNTFNWKIQHNLLHHTFTNNYGFDPDIDTKAVLRLSEHAPLKKIHRLQFVYAYFFYGLMTLFKLFTDIKQLVDFSKRGITREQNHKPSVELLKLIITKVVYFFVFLALPIWVTDYAWWQVVLGFAIMHVTAGMIMSTVFQLAHVVEGPEQPIPDGDNIIHDEWMVHELRTTADFARNSRVLNWFIGGLNFQIEHHLFPNICHIHYRRIAPIVEQTAKEFGLPYHHKRGFGSAFASHVRKLKSLGRHR